MKTSLINNRMFEFSARLLITATVVSISIFLFMWSLVQLIKDEPQVESLPDGTVILTSTAAKLHGPPEIKHESLAGEKDIGYWDYDTQWISWSIPTPPPGNYAVTLRYARPGSSKVDLTLTIGKVSLKKAVPGTGSWDRWKSIKFGNITVVKGKQQPINLKASKPPSTGVINFVFIKLTPVKMQKGKI